VEGRLEQPAVKGDPVMKVCNVNGIGEFHARLFSGAETSKLFGALRKLAQLDDPRLLSESKEDTLDGWPVWTDTENAVPAAVPQPA
jgi:hypothetical protein